MIPVMRNLHEPHLSSFQLLLKIQICDISTTKTSQQTISFYISSYFTIRTLSIAHTKFTQQLKPTHHTNNYIFYPLTFIFHRLHNNNHFLSEFIQIRLSIINTNFSSLHQQLFRFFLAGFVEFKWIGEILRGGGAW